MAMEKKTNPEFVSELECTNRRTGEKTKFHLMRDTVPFIERVAMANTVVDFVCPPGKYYPYYKKVVFTQVLAQAYTDVKVDDFFEWLRLYEETNIAEILLENGVNEDEYFEMHDWINQMIQYRRTHNASEEFFRGLAGIFSNDCREKIGKYVSYLADAAEQVVELAKAEAEQGMNSAEGATPTLELVNTEEE